MPRGRPRKTVTVVNQPPESVPINVETKTKVEVTARPVEVIKKELADAKSKLSEVDSISIDRDFDKELDNSAVPIEIQNAFPDMNFHWSRTIPKDITKKLAARYQIVHIPASCKDILAVYKSMPRSRLTDAYGDDVMVRGDELILMMCPKPHYHARKQRLEDLRKARSQNNADKNADSLKKGLGGDIKQVKLI